VAAGGPGSVPSRKDCDDSVIGHVLPQLGKPAESLNLLLCFVTDFLELLGLSSTACGPSVHGVWQAETGCLRRACPATGGESGSSRRPGSGSAGQGTAASDSVAAPWLNVRLARWVPEPTGPLDT